MSNRISRRELIVPVCPDPKGSRDIQFAYVSRQIGEYELIFRNKSKIFKQIQPQHFRSAELISRSLFSFDLPAIRRDEFQL